MDQLDMLVENSSEEEAGAQIIWFRAGQRNNRVEAQRPLLPINGWVPKKVYTTKQIISGVQIEVVDATIPASFKVEFSGTFKVGDAIQVVRTSTDHPGLRSGVEKHLQDILNGLEPASGLLALLFPKNGNASEIKIILKNAFKECGLHVVNNLTINAIPQYSQQRLEFKFGPRNVLPSDPGRKPLSVTVEVDLEQDNNNIYSYLTSRLPMDSSDATKQTYQTVLKEVIFDFLKAKFSFHEHIYECAKIEKELVEIINQRISATHGRKVSFLRLDNGIRENGVAPIPELFEFTSEYAIAANTEKMMIVHRSEFNIVNCGNCAPLSDVPGFVKERIIASTQRLILALPEPELNAQIFVYKSGNTNIISERIKKDDQLLKELSQRGIELRELFIFSNCQPNIDSGSNYSFSRDGGYPLRGEARTLDLTYFIDWKIGVRSDAESNFTANDTLDAYRKFISKGAPSTSELEHLLNARAERLTLLKIQKYTVGDALFEIFERRRDFENEISSLVEHELNAFAADYGVVVITVGTLVHDIPEAKFLVGHEIHSDGAQEYHLAEEDQTLSVGFILSNISLKKDTKELIRQCISESDPNGVDTAIKKAIQNVIRSKMIATNTTALLNSLMGGGDDTTLGDDIKRSIRTDLDNRFGLQVLDENVNLNYGQTPLVTLRNSMKGYGSSLNLVFNNIASEVMAKEILSTVAITVNWRIDNIGKSSDDCKHFLNNARRWNELSDIKVEIDRILHACLEPLCSVWSSEIYAREVFHGSGLSLYISRYLENEILHDLGINISIPPNQILADADNTGKPSQLSRLYELLETLNEKRIELLANIDLEPEDEENIEKYKARIDQIENEINAQLNKRGLNGELSKIAIKKSLERTITTFTRRGYPELANELNEKLALPE